LYSFACRSKDCNINLILVLINCIVTMTASQPRYFFYNATRVASAPIVIAPFDSPDLLPLPLLCTTVIRNVVTDVTDLCHRIAIVHQTVRDHTMCCSCVTPHVPFALTTSAYIRLFIVRALSASRCISPKMSVCLAFTATAWACCCITISSMKHAHLP